MIRLFGVEVRRLLARRTFRVLMLLLIVGTAIVMINQGARSNRNLAAARAAAAAQARALAAQLGPRPFCAPSVRTTAQPAPAVVPATGSAAAGVAQAQPPEMACQGPTAADFYTDPRFRFAASGPNLITGAVVAVGILGFVIGASLIGAEWSAGTFPALMTWEPRRLRLLATKTGAAVAVLLAVGVLAMAVNLGAGWLIAATRGTLAGTTARLMSSLLLRGLRGLLVIGLLTLVGTAIAGLARSTAAAIGVVVVYLVGVEIVLQHLVPSWGRWLLTNNAAALLNGHAIYLTAGLHQFSRLRPFALSPARAVVYLLLLSTGLLVAHAIALTRRDAT